MSEATTIPGLLAAQAAARPTAVAFRLKRLGLWRDVTWSEYAETVGALARGLEAIGVAAGHRVAVIADNEPRWLYADLAIQSLGATTVAVYPALGVTETAAALRDASVRVAVCGDQEQVDKLMEAGDLAGVEQLLVFELKGLHTPEYAGVPMQSFADVVERGRGTGSGLTVRAAETGVATVSLTSGTSGPTRLVELGQAGQVHLARLAARELGFTERDRGYALLPLANATSRTLDAYVPLVVGSSLAFPESHETVPLDMVEACPTVVVASPRLLERTRGEIELRSARAGWLKRRIAQWGLHALGTATGEPRTGIAGALADLLVGRFVRGKAGLGNVRLAVIGGSPLSDSLAAWFRALRVPVREVYGQTEAGGLVTAQRSAADAGTAGWPLGDDIELRLDGEDLLVRSPGLALSGAQVDDGWLRTGDLARLDGDGRLVPLGRVTDLLETAAGDRLLPADAENALRASPYVASAMIVAAGRSEVTALLELEMETLSDWARRSGVPVTTYASLASNDEVLKLVEKEVAAANATLPPELAVRRFRILPRPLASELTPTGKIRRDVVQATHRELIEEMYA